MNIAFKKHNFHRATLKVIHDANEIVDEYLEQGFILTLRQLYYQCVARDLIPNTQKSYKRLGVIVNNARLTGLLSWDAIEDRTRNITNWRFADSPEEEIKAAMRSYNHDKWKNQPSYVEVWVEKEALAGVVQRICQRVQVPFLSCRGYVSQSEMFEAGYRRLARRVEGGQDVVVLHLGDHDPSGIDMTRDIEDRIRLFACEAEPNIDINRIALNMVQIKEHDPPPNPAKETDSRYRTYIDQFGSSSWELDALPPNVLSGLIESHVDDLRDDDQWDADVNLQEWKRDELRMIHENYDQALWFLRDGPAEMDLERLQRHYAKVKRFLEFEELI